MARIVFTFLEQERSVGSYEDVRQLDQWLQESSRAAIGLVKRIQAAMTEGGKVELSTADCAVLLGTPLRTLALSETDNDLVRLGQTLLSVERVTSGPRITDIGSGETPFG